MSKSQAEARALSFLQRGPLVRFGLWWRFGTAKVANRTLEPLLARGEAVREGDTVRTANPPVPDCPALAAQKRRGKIIRGWQTRRARGGYATSFPFAATTNMERR